MKGKGDVQNWVSAHPCPGLSPAFFRITRRPIPASVISGWSASPLRQISYTVADYQIIPVGGATRLRSLRLVLSPEADTPTCRR